MGIFSYLKAKKQEKRDVKHSIVNAALSEIFEDCVYNPEGSINRERIRDASLIDEWDEGRDNYDANTDFRFTGNDYFIGKYKGREVECCDVEVTKHYTVIDTDDDGNETERKESETSFKGVWMICRTDMPIPAMLRIRGNADMPLLFRFIAKRIPARSDVKTENLDFNKQFQILTCDSHSAFYVLTPHFMEHILSADKQTYGRTMLCFSGDSIHIAIHNGRDPFEIKKSSEVKDPDALKQRVFGEINYLTGILDELFRNDKLFRKG